jgi:DNA polymerase III epsilon subunit-like protein
MTIDISKKHRLTTILSARRVLARQPLYLDTETTGTDWEAEIVEIAIINDNGGELLNTLVKPGNPIPANATRIHGIGDMDVAGAPHFDVVWHAQLRELLTGARLRFDQPILIYNAAFDLRLIRQSLMQYGIEPAGLKPPFCLMKLYAEFHGEWNYAHGDFRWHTLASAAAQCGMNVTQSHRALDDALLARAVLHYIATQEIDHEPASL